MMLLQDILLFLCYYIYILIRTKDGAMVNEQNIQKFNDAINAFYSSRLIIVDKAIAEFLKTIASDNSFMEVLADATKTADYRQEYQKAIVNDVNGLSFRLPMNKRHVIALVVGLLLEFDRKDLSIIEFVRKFYPAEASHDSYLAFCEQVIKPFSEAFKSVYLGEEETYSTSTIADREEKPFNDKAKEETDYWLRLVIDGIMSDNSFTNVERKDFITMIKGLMYVTELANPLLIKLNWLGIKYSLGTRKSIYRELKEVETILINYGVID